MAHRNSINLLSLPLLSLILFALLKMNRLKWEGEHQNTAVTIVKKSKWTNWNTNHNNETNRECIPFKYIYVPQSI